MALHLLTPVVTYPVSAPPSFLNPTILSTSLPCPPVSTPLHTWGPRPRISFLLAASYNSFPSWKPNSTLQELPQIPSPLLPAAYLHCPIIPSLLQPAQDCISIRAQCSGICICHLGRSLSPSKMMSPGGKRQAFSFSTSIPPP